MGGLIFLFVIALWVAICVYLAFKIPKWLGIQHLGWILGLLLFPALLVAPVIDEIVGKQQLERLCDKRVFREDSEALNKANRIRKVKTPHANLRGYWIPIDGDSLEYVDEDSGRVVLAYTDFHTNGGWLLGGSYIFGMAQSCHFNPTEIDKLNRLEKLFEEGKKS